MRALILMTKVPVAGFTKKGLMNVFSAEECAQLHKCFLKDEYEVLSELDDTTIFVSYSPEYQEFVDEMEIPDAFERFVQVGATLEERSEYSLQTVFDKGFTEVLMIGSDMPHIMKETIMESFNLLTNNDLVIGPTFYGGYYIIGMKKLHKNLFFKKEIAESRRIDRTLELAKERGLTVSILHEGRDIDRLEDIIALYNVLYEDSLTRAKKTFKFFVNWSKKLEKEK